MQDALPISVTPHFVSSPRVTRGQDDGVFRGRARLAQAVTLRRAPGPGNLETVSASRLVCIPVKTRVTPGKLRKALNWATGVTAIFPDYLLERESRPRHETK